MISAANTASGRSVNRRVRATTVTRLRSAATNGDSLRPGPSAIVDGALGETAATGQAAENGRPDVGQAECDHLLVGVELVSVLVGEGLAGPECLAENDEHHAQRARKQHP